MAENMNVKLDDEIMSKVAGGAEENAPAPKYHTGDRCKFIEDPDYPTLTVVAEGNWILWKGRWRYEYEVQGENDTFTMQVFEEELMFA